MLLSITDTPEKPLVHALPVSGLVDLRALASISCWRSGPAVWMYLPVDTPMTVVLGLAQVALGSTA